MRAALLTADRPTLELATVGDPTPGASEVVLDVTACGICGSDLHVASAVGAVGTILGHEIAGRIAAVGLGVDSAWAIGTPVVARPLTGCGQCVWCQKGRSDHCAQFALVGVDRPGGFAEQVVVSADELYRAPTSLSGPEHALVEPLAIARRALRRADLRPGEDVLVLGGGPVGLAVVAWARALGAGTIVVSEPVEIRRALAQTLGANACIDPTAVVDSDIDALVSAHFASPPAVVVECTGAPGLIGQGLVHAAIDGRVIVVGICLATDQIFPWFGIQKELDVRFSLYYGREDFVETIGDLDSGRLVAAEMVTETVTLGQLPARFAEMVRTPDAGKVVLVP